MNYMTSSRPTVKGAPSMREILLFAEAVAMLALAALAIGLLPFRAVARTMQFGSSRWRRPILGEPAQAVEMVTAVQRASRHTPWRTVCFQEGLALHWMLRRRGVGSVLHYGLSSVQEFGAHVWVSLDGEILIGGGQAPNFHCVATFPASEKANGC